MDETRVLIIYHGADYDGIFSGAVAYKKMSTTHKYVDMVPWDFGQPLININGYDKVVIVDLLLGCVEGLDNEVASGNLCESKFIWIDHHKTAIEKYPSSVPGLRADGIAACRLAYQYFYPDGSEPYILTLVGKFDVWDQTDPLAQPLQFALLAKHGSVLNSCPRDFCEEYLVYPNDFSTRGLAQEGQKILDWQNQFAGGVVKSHGYIVELEGIKFLTLVSPHARSSMWYPEECLNPDAEATMNIRMDGTNNLTISLYHRTNHEHLDLSLIAKKFGGGGHRGACGFEMAFCKALKMGLFGRVNYE